MLSECDGEESLEIKEIKPVNLKENQPWILIGRTDTEAEAPILRQVFTWCEELTHWKIPWCWERLKAKGEGDSRVWDGWWHHRFLDFSVSRLWEIVKDREAWHAAVHEAAKCQTWLSYWTARLMYSRKGTVTFLLYVVVPQWQCGSKRLNILQHVNNLQERSLCESESW